LFEELQDSYPVMDCNNSWAVQLKHPVDKSVVSNLLEIQWAASRQPPIAKFTVSPSILEVPLDVSFDGSDSFDPDGSIVSYEWSINGESFSGPKVSLNYHLVGSYPITLTVKDNDGITNTYTETIELFNLSFSPRRDVDFETVEIDQQSPLLTFAFSQKGNTKTNISRVYLDGSNSSNFTIQEDGCTGKTLTASSVCRVSVTFSPTSEGEKNNVGLCFANNNNTRCVAGLHGIGVKKLLQQQGLMPPSEVFNQISYFVYKPKEKFAANWATLSRGWQHAGIYIGDDNGKHYILHATTDADKKPVPPRLNTLNELLESIDGKVDKMMWITVDGTPSEFTRLFGLARIVADNPAYMYPAIRYDLADKAAENIQNGLIYSNNVQELIKSFGPKDPLEAGTSTTLYCSQLVYLMYKYGLDEDIEEPHVAWSLLVDKDNLLVTPVDLLPLDFINFIPDFFIPAGYTSNKRVVYEFEDNVKIPVVQVQVEGNTVTVKWDLPQGQETPDGWNLYFRDSDSVYMIPLKGGTSSYSTPLAKGCVDVIVAPSGNSKLVVDAKQDKWESFCIK
jgi:PKD repeat protein